MNRARVLIVDDEAPARARLRSLLEEAPDMEVVGEASQGETAVELARRLAPDIVLLDIHMPGMNGLEAARHLAALAQPPAVIFATAFDDYALQAFEAQAIAYLMKPVRREKLFAALAHSLRLTRLPRPQTTGLAARPAVSPVHVEVRQRNGIKLIAVENVLVFLAEQKLTRVRHTEGDDLIEDSLRILEARLGSEFIRIHRSALVSVSRLEQIERGAQGQYSVRVRGLAQPLPVSRRMAGELRSRFVNLT